MNDIDSRLVLADLIASELTRAQTPVKLNLGAGEFTLEGYDNSWDAKQGKSVYPLEIADASVDEIRASHLLEHFSHRTVHHVLADWVRKLKPGGLCKLAVPDFEMIAHAYVDHQPWDFQGFVSGGHEDQYDIHQTMFDYAGLAVVMRDCGLIGIHKWKGHTDCSVYPVSLNLAGWRPPEKAPKVLAVMSVPRLGFMDNFQSILRGLNPLGIEVRKYTGAFWGQCLTRAIEESLEEDPDWILTLDYDSVFTQETIQDLLAFAVKFPDVDALCPIQMSRGTDGPIMRPKNLKAGSISIARDDLDETLLELQTGHFGCTLLRVEALKRIRKPWFWSQPDKNNAWKDGHLDDDIRFWKLWDEAGLKLFQANRVVIGHAELQIIWPDNDLKPIYQHPPAFWKDGPPVQMWK